MKDLTPAELEALEAEAAYYDRLAREQDQREATKTEILEGMTVDDLLTNCTDCNQGEVPNPAWQHTYAEGFDWENYDYQALQRRSGPEFLPCPECEGSCKVLTPAGKAIAALFHHLQRR